MDQLAMPLIYKKGDQMLTASNEVLFLRTIPPEQCETLNRQLEIEVKRNCNQKQLTTYWQTSGDWLNGTAEPIGKLRSILKDAINHYLINIFNRNHAHLDGLRLSKNFRHELKIWGWGGGSVGESSNPPHVHRNAHLSGIYYIKGLSKTDVDPTDYSGCVTFIFGDSAQEVLMGSYAATNLFPIHPIPGTLVIFPSFLRHFVHRFRFRQFERLYVSFNCQFSTPLEAMSDPTRKR
ncbi:2OG-Fe(II) oxygenase family protein [Verrucomicrobia bacterium]|nr:2OG-Fe(II) oxygenase family protein [Verrucomicrobiota bacterium]